MKFFNLFRRKPAAPAWLPPTDAGITDDPGVSVQPGPIRIKHFPLVNPMFATKGDFLTGHLTYTDECGVTTREDTPTFELQQSMMFDRVAKIEVIDDLGFDIGIGFIWGQAK
jgi:hypothetical protein